jgi:hypothetical protein
VVKHFRGNVIGSSELLIELLVGDKLPRGSEVYDFEGGALLLGLVDEVLWLEVSMDYVLLVAVEDSL